MLEEWLLSVFYYNFILLAKHAAEPEKTLTPMEAMLYESMNARLKNVAKAAQRRNGINPHPDYRYQENQQLQNLVNELARYKYY